jgi:hypothetical protein
MINAAAVDGKGVRPVVDGRDLDYVANCSAQLKQLLRAALTASDYAPKNGLLLYSSLPTVCDANEDLIDQVMKPAFADAAPPTLFVGYAPVLAAMGCSRSMLPTALVVDLVLLSSRLCTPRTLLCVLACLYCNFLILLLSSRLLHTAHSFVCSCLSVLFNLLCHVLFTVYVMLLCVSPFSCFVSCLLCTYEL